VAEKTMKEKFASTDFACKVALLFVFGAFWLLARPFPEDSRQFPQLLAAISLLLTLVALAADFVRRGGTPGEIGDVDDTELKPVNPETRSARRRRFWQAWAILLASAGAGLVGGFLYSAIGLFAGFALAFGSGEKRAGNLFIAAALTAVVYFVFGKLMGVPLMEGLL
jgi:hypothetical protein